MTRHPAAPRAHPWLLAAAALGLVHAGFSLYWALGGGWLIETLGTGILTAFDGKHWALFPVAAVKGGFALIPLWWAASGRVRRGICWLGAAVLVAWGGLNTVVGNLVLAGVVTSNGGYDRPGMVGHAWLWDPLFLAWGLALAVGLWMTRPPAVPRSQLAPE